MGRWASWTVAPSGACLAAACMRAGRRAVPDVGSRPRAGLALRQSRQRLSSSASFRSSTRPCRRRRSSSPMGPSTCSSRCTGPRAQRYSDTYLTSGKPRRRSDRGLDAPAPPGRRQFHQPDALPRAPRRGDGTAGAGAPARRRDHRRGIPRRADRRPRARRRSPIWWSTATRRSTALFMREDRGFYGVGHGGGERSRTSSRARRSTRTSSFALPARATCPTSSSWSRAATIRFTRNAVIVFAGCGVAGKRDIEPSSIAARMAEITGAKVIASIDVTDQSMGRGRELPQPRIFAPHLGALHARAAARAAEHAR